MEKDALRYSRLMEEIRLIVRTERFENSTIKKMTLGAAFPKLGLLEEMVDLLLLDALINDFALGGAAEAPDDTFDNVFFVIITITLALMLFFFFGDMKLFSLRVLADFGEKDMLKSRPSSSC
jgi:hypothetical protein